MAAVTSLDFTVLEGDVTINDSLFSEESESHSFKDEDTWLRVLNGVIMALILSFSIVGNSTVILLVIFHKKLQYRSVIVSMGLVLADLFVAVLWTTQSLIVTVIGEWPFEATVCDVLGTVWLILLYAKWLECAVVSLDRFFIVAFPFKYCEYSRSILIILTLFAWIIPVVFVTPGTFLLDPFEFRLQVTACTVDCLSGKHGESCFPYYSGLFVVFVSLGGVMPTVLYLTLYCISRRKRVAMKHRLGTLSQKERPQVQSDLQKERPRVQSDLQKERPQVQPDHSSIVSTSTGSRSSSFSSSSSSSRKSSIETLKTWSVNRDKRALVTFFIVFLTLLVTQIPLIIVSGLRDKPEIYREVPLWVHLVATYISLLSPALDPIVVMRNRDFRKVIVSVLNKRKTMPTLSKKKKLEFRRNSSFSLNLVRTPDQDQQLQLKTVLKVLSQKMIDSTISEDSTDSLSQTEEPVIASAHHVMESTESPE